MPGSSEAAAAAAQAGQGRRRKRGWAGRRRGRGGGGAGAAAQAWVGRHKRGRHKRGRGGGESVGGIDEEKHSCCPRIPCMPAPPPPPRILWPCTQLLLAALVRGRHSLSLLKPSARTIPIFHLLCHSPSANPSLKRPTSWAIPHPLRCPSPLPPSPLPRRALTLTRRSSSTWSARILSASMDASSTSLRTSSACRALDST